VESGAPSESVDTLHLKAWSVPGVKGTNWKRRTHVAKVVSGCDEDISRALIGKQTAVLGGLPSVDARLTGEAAYVHTVSYRS
jgi:hypothetical protein